MTDLFYCQCCKQSYKVKEDHDESCPSCGEDYAVCAIGEVLVVTKDKHAQSNPSST
jgi:Zn finger protein HypA/HybF involved in hydrogenase expression